MKGRLADSYAACRRSARQAASHFYYSFYLLGRRRRQSMFALYAYLRRTDDLGDSPLPAEKRRRQLAAWREDLRAALAGDCQQAILPALVDTVGRYNIPQQYLYDVIDGMEMDLEPTCYATFADLQEYCYRVASVVGLACIHIWGFHSDRALQPARTCGQAFQLTNILRDLAEDAQRGRVYLPQEDLARFGYTHDDLRGHVCDDRFRRLMRFQIERAERLFREALPLEPYLSSGGRRIFRAMVATYYRLLQEINRRDGDVFSSRVQIGRGRRASLAMGAALGHRRLCPALRSGAKSPAAPEDPPQSYLPNDGHAD